MKKKLNNNSIYLLCCITINCIFNLFVNTFLVAYLLNISSNNIFNVSIFYIIAYSVLGILFFLVAPLMKKLNLLIPFRIGIFVKLLFLLSIVLLKEHISNYIVLVAIFFGLAETVYWSGVNPLLTKVNSKDTMKSFISATSIVDKLVGIIVPFILGSSIDILSFPMVSIIMLCLSLVQFIFSLFIKIEKTNSTHFSYKEFVTKIKSVDNSKLIKLAYFNVFLNGIKYIVPTLIVFMTILTFKTNTSLGILTSIFAVVSILILLLFNIRKNARTNIIPYIICGILPCLSVIYTIISLTKVSLVIFNLTYIGCIIIIDTLVYERRCNTILELDLDNYIVENMSLSEVALDLGRVVGYILLLLVGILNNLIISTIVLIGCSILIVICSIFTYLLEIKIQQNKEKTQITENQINLQ